MQTWFKIASPYRNVLNCVLSYFSLSHTWFKITSPYCNALNCTLSTLASDISNKLFLCRNTPIKLSLRNYFSIYLLFSKHKPFHPILFRHSNFHFQIQVHFHFSITFYIQPYSRLISHVDAYTTQQHCIFLATHDSRGHEIQQHCILLTTHESRLTRTWNPTTLHTSHDSRVTTHENMESNNTAYFSRLTTHENIKLNDCMFLSTHDDSRVTCFRRVYMIIIFFYR